MKVLSLSLVCSESEVIMSKRLSVKAKSVLTAKKKIHGVWFWCEVKPDHGSHRERYFLVPYFDGVRINNLITSYYELEEAAVDAVRYLKITESLLNNYKRVTVLEKLLEKE